MQMANLCRQSQTLFVVGFYRSGTSLLYALLNQHPDISLMYECDILKMWPLAGANSIRPDWLERLEFWNHSLSRHRLNGLSAPNVLDRRGAAIALYRSFAAKKGAAVMGEKSPYYHDCLPRLAHDFPEARIIALWRSPEQILSSIRSAAAGERFFAGSHWARRIDAGIRSMAAGVQKIRAGGHAVLEVDYHDLLNSQEATLRAICDFIGIDYGPGMQSLEGADLSMLPAGEHHRKVRGGKVISRAGENTAKWSADTALCQLRTRQHRVDAFRFSFRDIAVRTIYTHVPITLLDQWRQSRARQFQGKHPIAPPGGSVLEPSR